MVAQAGCRWGAPRPAVSYLPPPTLPAARRRPPPPPLQGPIAGALVAVPFFYALSQPWEMKRDAKVRQELQQWESGEGVVRRRAAAGRHGALN